ncbi:hypothetical protein [Amycolatopsis minnesotensis]|uniref:SnoaL-like domain-containing protein n=1 Tax=Amycolatopsis minnesotensis TaxID=337894 RepID=A0ABP5E0C5_9PSEU
MASIPGNSPLSLWSCDAPRRPLAQHGADRPLALGERTPVAHHVTDVVVTERDGSVFAHAKGIGVMANGTCDSVTYQDTVVRGQHGWRISPRGLIARRAPLGR